MEKSQLLKIAQSVNCEYEAGIWSEIDSFMEYQNERVSDFALSYNELEKYYDLKILMLEFDDPEVHSLFHRLVEFIEYKHSTLYIKEKNDHIIEYFFLSSSKDLKGFFMKIKVFKSKDKFDEMKF